MSSKKLSQKQREELVATLKARGFPLIDCQLETDHLMSLGAEAMPRRAFVAEVARLVKEPPPVWHVDEDLAGNPSHAPRTLLPAPGSRFPGPGL